MMDDEQRLLERVQEEDMQAFEVLYERLKGNVFSLAYQMLKSKEDAEEVLQDSFTKIYGNANSYKPKRGSVRAFIYTIARNECISRLRKQKVRPQASEIEVETLHVSSPETSNEQRLYAQSALSILPDEERCLVHKAFYHGYSHSEIANTTGLPLGTVKTKLRQALNRMKTHLEQA